MCAFSIHNQTKLQNVDISLPKYVCTSHLYTHSPDILNRTDFVFPNLYIACQYIFFRRLLHEPSVNVNNIHSVRYFIWHYDIECNGQCQYIRNVCTFLVLYFMGICWCVFCWVAHRCSSQSPYRLNGVGERQTYDTFH